MASQPPPEVLTRDRKGPTSPTKAEAKVVAAWPQAVALLPAGVLA